MELVFVGWNHRGAPLDLRERLAFTPDKARKAMEGLFAERILIEGAIVSTCNRAEVYGLSEVDDSFSALAGFFSRFHSVDRAVLESTALSGRGDATVRHLFRVASGPRLDGPRRGADPRPDPRGAPAGVGRGGDDPRRHEPALHVGDRVRATECGTRRARPAADVGPGIALSSWGGSSSELQGRRVLLIGAGETVELTARLLVDDGATDLLFANRSPEKAESLAASVGGRPSRGRGAWRAFADVGPRPLGDGLRRSPSSRAEALRLVLAEAGGADRS